MNQLYHIDVKKASDQRKGIRRLRHFTPLPTFLPAQGSTLANDHIIVCQYLMHRNRERATELE